MEISAQLRELARNLWWSWHPDAILLFRDLDPDLWRRVNHNPVTYLEQIPAERLARRAEELALEARVNFAFHRQHEYLKYEQSWGDVYARLLRSGPVAYFSPEFGLHESIPVYSGGLGVLAGDHLKAASDLGLPLCGVGLFYAQGYFNQRLDASGWQQESYQETEVDQLPLELIRDREGQPVKVSVDSRWGRIAIGLWRARVGRCSLILLDTDQEENRPEDRELTGRLYGGDEGLRIRQELILGVGGARALATLGIRPGIIHLNEGHSAFAILEKAREHMVNDGLDFTAGLHRVSQRTVFTTHTPVEAGHDRFSAELVEQALGKFREKLGLSPQQLMDLGRVRPGDNNELFCMTTCALKAARKANAVSHLHGLVTRRMWQGLWPGRAETEVPIAHITNGVHVASWMSTPMRQLFDRYLGPEWPRQICRPDTWLPLDRIEDGELWEVRQILKARLIGFVQRRVCDQEARRSGESQACDLTRQRLDPGVLTIGIARRFATYKRGDMILYDDQRLERLILNPERPVQVIFSGKAHPKDEPGKHLIQRIFRMSQDPRFLGRLVFLEDYDINVGRHLVQGVDLWLNTPRRPREASGTSGMKAMFNGVLNLSTLDGWWAEAYDGDNGFAIGGGGMHADQGEQDRRDAADLYRALEEEVVPLFYDRDEGGVPRQWVARMKRAIRGLAWRFNADRMLRQYAQECYLPLAGMYVPPGASGEDD